MHVSVVVGGNMCSCILGRTPLWTPSPMHWRNWRVQEGTLVPFELLCRSSVWLRSMPCLHARRACSLLVIPPPKEREPPPGSFPKDLSDLNLSSWAGLVQDATSSLLAPPPNLGSEVSLPDVALLELLKKTTGWGYCRFCYHLGSRCACMGAYSPAPPPSWSQVVGESPGCRATASSGDMTAPSTPAAGMSGYLPHPPGLPPIDFSKWRLLPPEAPASRGPTAPPNLPQFEGHSKEDHRGAPSRWTGPTDASTAHVDTMCTPDGAASLTTTPGGASHALPASGTTAKEACGEGSHC